jgi:hypothetical protein
MNARNASFAGMAAIGLLLGVYSVHQTVRTEKSGELFWTIALYFAVTILIVGSAYLAMGLVGSGARAAVRALLTRKPPPFVFVALGDNVLLGSIAQLRPDIQQPERLGRLQVVAATELGLEVWGESGATFNC